MDNERLIKDAQYRKGLSIAYFNSLNASINLVTAQGTRFSSEEQMLETIDKYKMLFIAKHDEYYKNTLAVVRAPFNLADSIKKIKGAKTLEQLKAFWTAFSEDERRHPDILKTKEVLKKKLTPKSK